MLRISYPTLSDAEALLAFELENHSCFEQWINARASDYYTRSAVRDAIKAAVADIDGDRAYQFLVRYDDTIVGRVNLVGVTRPYFNKATLGYRIGRRFAGILLSAAPLPKRSERVCFIEWLSLSVPPRLFHPCSR
jgi:[ribosomal protein S5]-alanine N-acetyltransferase